MSSSTRDAAIIWARRPATDAGPLRCFVVGFPAAESVVFLAGLALRDPRLAALDAPDFRARDPSRLATARFPAFLGVLTIHPFLRGKLPYPGVAANRHGRAGMAASVKRRRQLKANPDKISRQQRLMRQRCPA
jgi:hypothetical protein